MKKRTAHIYLRLNGDFDPTELDAKIDIKADKCEAKHSRNAEHRLPRTAILSYADCETYDELIDIYGLADRVTNILIPHQDSLRTAIADFDAVASLQVVLHFPISEEVSTPILGFSRQVVDFVSTIGAFIDVDTYRQY